MNDIDFDIVIRAIILATFVTCLGRLFFRACVKHAYDKGYRLGKQWANENNDMANWLRNGAVNRGYAEWRVTDGNNRQVEFKWIEPKFSNGGLTKQ